MKPKSYFVIIKSVTGAPLIGGVPEIRSSRFADIDDARNYALAILENHLPNQCDVDLQPSQLAPQIARQIRH